MLSSVEHEKSYISSKPDHNTVGFCLICGLTSQPQQL